jgi:hypothetical protein
MWALHRFGVRLVDSVMARAALVADEGEATPEWVLHVGAVTDAQVGHKLHSRDVSQIDAVFKRRRAAPYPSQLPSMCGGPHTALPCYVLLALHLRMVRPTCDLHHQSMQPQTACSTLAHPPTCM